MVAAGLVVAGVAVFFLLGSSGTRIGGPIAQAATLSSGAPGYRMRMSTEVRSSAVSAPITGSARGVVDLRDRATSVSMTMNLDDDPQVAQQLGSSTLRIDIVTSGDVVYARLPSALTAPLPTAGRSWIKLDVAKLSDLPGLSSLGNNPTTTDPNSMLQFLRSQSGNAVDEGSQRVDGTRTTHYRVEPTLSQIVNSFPANQRAALQQALSHLAQAVADERFPVDVWVDARSHVRRVAMTLNLAIPSGPSLRETVTMDLSHYGPQRAPATPPPDQVMDLSSLPGAAG